MNEIGHSFLCNKSPVHIQTWRKKSGDFVRVQYKNGYNANEMKGQGLKMPHKAQVICRSKLCCRAPSEAGISYPMYNHDKV